MHPFVGVVNISILLLRSRQRAPTCMLPYRRPQFSFGVSGESDSGEGTVKVVRHRGGVRFSFARSSEAVFDVEVLVCV